MRVNGFASSLALLLRRFLSARLSRDAQNIRFRFARYVRLFFSLYVLPGCSQTIDGYRIFHSDIFCRQHNARLVDGLNSLYSATCVNCALQAHSY